MKPGFGYAPSAQDGSARSGLLTTPHAVVPTPTFMPVGTQASVKSQTPAELAASGAGILLANTYHLMLRPGAERIAALGGLHRFMAWPGALLTDSGGYQVFSLARLRRIDDDGVDFRSHLDGSAQRLDPERAMAIQGLLGSDIAMVLDECPDGGAERAAVEAAVARTTHWLDRCLAAPCPDTQARFGIVQGGTHRDLRLAHLEEVASRAVDGVALGGFSVGEPIEAMHGLVAELGPRMPAERPRYLMGVGKPVDLLRAVGAGIDMFDCVLPTRNARNGQALTWGGRVNVKQRRHQDDGAPLDARCDCPVCAGYSRAYLRHLIASGEMLGPRLLTQHNLSFYGALMQACREAIARGRYEAFAREAEQRMIEQDEVGDAG